jgi:hypothetical protein
MPTIDWDYAMRLISHRVPEIDLADVIAPFSVNLPDDIARALVEVLDALEERIRMLEARRTAAE